MGTYRKEDTKGLIMEIQGDYWALYEELQFDNHNRALMAMMCFQYHVTPMGSHMIRYGESRDQVGIDRTHRVTRTIG